jgi:hypothetical protein
MKKIIFSISLILASCFCVNVFAGDLVPGADASVILTVPPSSLTPITEPVLINYSYVGWDSDTQENKEYYKGVAIIQPNGQYKITLPGIYSSKAQYGANIFQLQIKNASYGSSTEVKGDYGRQCRALEHSVVNLEVDQMHGLISCKSGGFAKK